MKQGSALIIGGGIAGLAAALELARNKISTTVLEAKTRFGGRIHTIRHNGVPIEMGAEFIHGHSEALLGAIQNAGLSTQAIPGTNRTFENGKLHDSQIWDTIS
ncbi:MAG: FAD-dependent oxidoreductase, partial [Limisphaerales bacterium]